jgi:hypothetical protein
VEKAARRTIRRGLPPAEQEDAMVRCPCHATCDVITCLAAIYCRDCFKDIRNVCMICSDTVEFTADDDVSQEE